ncbi:unnamed protein product [Anisakis simplex]|uniref:EB domain-containing protein n=1 Tax=Anisakis simplex TaxID=6269 RepID=A0A0M3J1H3_ANISI|nr:unnamed protein product [Anisakis simplex]
MWRRICVYGWHLFVLNWTATCQRLCSSNEVLVNDVCLKRVRVGEECESSKQCLRGSSCHDGICECSKGHKLINGKCVRRTGRPVNTCPIVGQIPYVERGTAKIRFCSSSKKVCPRGFSCQFSLTAQRNVCCGNPPNGPIKSLLSTKLRPRQRNSEVCDNGTAYIVNGEPQKCITTTCPLDYECKFSDRAKNYFCCAQKRQGANGCPSGEALLFPSTRTPVQCSVQGPNTCPLGYKCVQSVTDGGYQCCTSNQSYPYYQRDLLRNRWIKTSQNIAPFHYCNITMQAITAPCPSNQVQVQRVVSGRSVKRCESSCPENQIAVQGICRDVTLDDSSDAPTQQS